MTFQNEGEMKTFTDKPRLGGSSKTMTLITKKKKKCTSEGAVQPIQQPTSTQRNTDYQ